MTEFGDRIKALRIKNGWSGQEAALTIFPGTHGSTSRGAKASFISGVETGRAVMQESSPDFEHVAGLLGCSPTELLKMVHQGQRQIRAAKVARSAPAKSAPAATGARVVKRKPGRKPRAEAVRPTNGHVNGADDVRAEHGLDAIASELTPLFQSSAMSPAIRGLDSDALSSFVRKVVGAACKVQGALS